GSALRHDPEKRVPVPERSCSNIKIGWDDDSKNCRSTRNSTWREIVLSLCRPHPESRPLLRKVLRDGAIEHDRFCPEQWRQRSVHIRVGTEVGQRQGLRPAAAAAAR